VLERKRGYICGGSRKVNAWWR